VVALTAATCGDTAVSDGALLVVNEVAEQLVVEVPGAGESQTLGPAGIGELLVGPRGPDGGTENCRGREVRVLNEAGRLVYQEDGPICGGVRLVLDETDLEAFAEQQDG
jgi:hypothetical protein